MLRTIESYAFEDGELCFGRAFLLLLEDDAEEAFLRLVPLQILLVLWPACLTVGALEVGTVSLDVVEHVPVPAQKLGGISPEQVGEPGCLGASEEDGMAAEKTPRVVERPKLGECLKIADAQLGHIGHGLCGGLRLQQFVELLHLAPCIDAVVVDDRCHLHVGIVKVCPVYLGVLFFFGDRLFFSVAGFGFAVFRA